MKRAEQKGIVRALLWLPRVLAAAFATFLALFALTAFFESMEFWQTTETFIAFAGWKSLPESLLSVFPPLGISTAYLARMLLLKETAEAERTPPSEVE